MKGKFILLAAMAALTGCGSGAHNESPSAGISLSGAFALYPLTVKWAEEYKKIHPDARIDISAGGAGKGITDVLAGVTNIGLVSRALTPEEVQKGADPIAVTRDAVVPTVSASNPFLKQLQARGLKKEEFNAIFITGQTKNWSQLGFSDAPVHVYTRSDAAGAAGLCDWSVSTKKIWKDLWSPATSWDSFCQRSDRLAPPRAPAGVGAFRRATRALRCLSPGWSAFGAVCLSAFNCSASDLGEAANSGAGVC